MGPQYRGIEGPGYPEVPGGRVNEQGGFVASSRAKLSLLQVFLNFKYPREGRNYEDFSLLLRWRGAQVLHPRTATARNM